MAIKHLANLDLNNNEIKNVKIDVVASDPTGFGVSQEGRIIYNSQDDEMKYWNGSAWVSMKNTDTDVDVSKANLLTRLAELSSSDTVNIGDADDDTTVVIRGNLQVDGTTTTVNSATLDVADNEITLNSDVTGSPSENAGIEVERGTANNVKIRWNETDDKWQFTNNGVEYSDLAAPPENASETTKGIIELATQHEARTGTDIKRAVTPDGLTAWAAYREFAGSIGDGSATSYTITHNFGTKDVIVQLYDVSTFDTVYADVKRNTDNTVLIEFNTAPSTNDIRVLITKCV